MPARAEAAAPTRFSASTSSSMAGPASRAGTAGSSACRVAPKVAV